MAYIRLDSLERLVTKQGLLDHAHLEWLINSREEEVHKGRYGTRTTLAQAPICARSGVEPI